ncbi:hypothetical protein BOQ00_09190, partial [Campylobacter coli]
ISEGVKALFAVYFKDQTEESFFKALNEFAKENQIASQKIRDKTPREIKEELSKLVTSDLLNAKFDKVEARIDKFEASLSARIDKVETSLNARIDKFEASLNAKFDKVETRIDKFEASLNAKFDKVDAKLDGCENSICAKLDSFRTEVKTYVIILAVLMFILQPTIFDFIISIFK